MDEEPERQSTLIISYTYKHGWLSFKLALIGIAYVIQASIVAGMLSRDTSDVYYMKQDGITNANVLPVVHVSHVAFSPPWVLCVAFFAAGLIQLVYVGPLRGWMMNSCVLRGKHTYRWLECAFVNTLVWLAATYEIGIRTEIALVLVCLLVIITWSVFCVVEHLVFGRTDPPKIWERLLCMLPSLLAWFILIVVLCIQLGWSFSSASSDAYTIGIVTVLFIGDLLLWGTMLGRLCSDTNEADIHIAGYTLNVATTDSTVLFIQRCIIFWIIMGKLYI
tara:strand:+ start:2727 stop:3557 length:831 start_codon:yes stop_codon:yes gene_type:complete